MLPRRSGERRRNKPARPVRPGPDRATSTSPSTITVTLTYARFRRRLRAPRGRRRRPPPPQEALAACICAGHPGRSIKSDQARTERGNVDPPPASVSSTMMGVASKAALAADRAFTLLAPVRYVHATVRRLAFVRAISASGMYRGSTGPELARFPRLASWSRHPCEPPGRCTLCCLARRRSAKSTRSSTSLRRRFN